MDARNMRIPPVIAHKNRPAMTRPRITMCGGSRHGGWDDLAHCVAQLDAAHRHAYAAYVQDRLRVFDQLLEIVVNARCT